MLVDLLASDNQVSYNIKVAHILGLHSSIYITELMNISMKASKKAKLVEDKYFVLDRRYITKRTTLGTDEQLAIDHKLGQLGILQKPAGGVDTIYLDIDKLATVLMSDDEKYLSKISKKAEVKTAALPGVKQTLKQKKIIEMKSYITITHAELRKALEDWVEGVYENPKGFLSKRAVELFQRDVDTFANGDLDIALKVIEIATMGGYREAAWAIEKFNKEYSNTLGRRMISPSDVRTRNVQLNNNEVF